MTEVKDAFRTAASRTKGQHNSPSEAAKSFLGSLKEASGDIGFPIAEDVGDNLAFAVLNRDAPREKRKESMRYAISEARNKLLARALPEIGIDGSNVVEKAQKISDSFAENIVRAATLYPQKPEGESLARGTLRLLNPNHASEEDRAVSACAIFDFFQPYLVDKLLDLNVYDPEQLRKQTGELRREGRLLVDFYKSTARAIEFAVEGKSSAPTDELIERLFQVGPIFTKLIQGIDMPDLLASKVPEQEKRDFIASLSKSMQEGVHPPDVQQQQDIAAALPSGLSFKGLISSASIAHVVQTETQEGEVRATKVKRPEIERKITDNEDTFNLVSKVYSRFIDEHIGGTVKGERSKQVHEVLPFLLRNYVSDIQQELDFAKEADTQKKASEVFSRHPGIRVPKIDEAHTDPEHITMEYIEGIRLENLPPDSRHLKNLFIFALESWRSGFVHGDAHGGNLKGGGDGSIIAYDWGKSVELPPDFARNMGRFLYAAVRRNPEALAKAYVKIQSADHNQITPAEAQVIAREVIGSQDETKGLKQKGALGRVKSGGKELQTTVKDLVVAMGIRHQNTMDTRYITALQTALRYGSVVSQELQKYEDQKVKSKVLVQSIGAAIKQVYFTNPKRGSS